MNSSHAGGRYDGRWDRVAFTKPIEQGESIGVGDRHQTLEQIQQLATLLLQSVVSALLSYYRSCISFRDVMAVRLLACTGSARRADAIAFGLAAAAPVA